MNISTRILQGIQSRYKKHREIPVYEKLLLEIRDYLWKCGARLIYVEPPFEYKIKGMTAAERERAYHWTFDLNHTVENIDKLKTVYGADITPEYILSLYEGGIVVQGSQRKVLQDFQGEHQHIINGRRVTVGQPRQYGNTIYTHGACTWRGTGVEDDQTIASYLQTALNVAFPSSYRVVNSAIGRGSTVYDDFQCIKEQQYKAGDIVILGSFDGLSIIPRSFYRNNDIPFIEASCLFHRPHNYGSWFVDNTLHTTAVGNKVIATAIFHELDAELHWLQHSSNAESQTASTPELSHLTTGQKIYGDDPKLMEFIHSLSSYRQSGQNLKNGSIVMNCNPFTLGHRYLIEYAAARVDHLYIFVVEENRSYFSFDDRIDLVRRGTADLPNVTVLPSGQFIISATTFPGYFYKDNLRETTIDCSNDLTVFAQYIAPALDIRVRFAGEEPLDPVTHQYNEAMQEILPQYGIEFHAIPRKTDADGAAVISASRVRQCYEQGDFETIRQLVPSVTYQYLLSRAQRS